MEYGLEREFFVKKGGAFCPAKPLPQDACGYLAEARGQPSNSINEAVFSLMAESHRMRVEAAKSGLTMVEDLDTTKFEPRLLREMIRQFGKKPSQESQGNMYGLKLSERQHKLSYAGIHIHFSQTSVFKYQEKWEARERKIYYPVNMPKIIKALDDAFKVEIKNAKRLPGMYEMKPWGFEYRSLPMSANLMKIIEVVNKI